MQGCVGNPYTLPTIEFVGGETQELIFKLYFHEKSKPFDTVGMTGNFSIVDYLNRNGSPIISKTMSAVQDKNDATFNTVRVTIQANETVNLNGKYIYQITLRDMSGETEIPNQGIIYIINNINKSVIAKS